jgi:hypothetical protein
MQVHLLDDSTASSCHAVHMHMPHVFRLYAEEHVWQKRCVHEKTACHVDLCRAEFPAGSPS